MDVEDVRCCISCLLIRKKMNKNDVLKLLRTSSRAFINARKGIRNVNGADICIIICIFVLLFQIHIRIWISFVY